MLSTGRGSFLPVFSKRRKRERYGRVGFVHVSGMCYRMLWVGGVELLY